MRLKAKGRESAAPVPGARTPSAPSASCSASGGCEGGGDNDFGMSSLEPPAGHLDDHAPHDHAHDLAPGHGHAHHHFILPAVPHQHRLQCRQQHCLCIDVQLTGQHLDLVE